MMSALRLGRQSAAIVATNWRRTTRASWGRYGLRCDFRIRSSTSVALRLGSVADPPEQRVGDLLRAEHLLGVGPWVPRAEDQRAQQQRRLARLDGELGAARLEDLGEPVEECAMGVQDEPRGPGWVTWTIGGLGHPDAAQGHHHRHHLLRAGLH